MDIIKKFGNKQYVFHNQEDVDTATDLFFSQITFTQNEFEEMLDDAFIDYEYEL